MAKLALLLVSERTTTTGLTQFCHSSWISPKNMAAPVGYEVTMVSRTFVLRNSWKTEWAKIEDPTSGAGERYP